MARIMQGGFLCLTVFVFFPSVAHRQSLADAAAKMSIIEMSDEDDADGRVGKSFGGGGRSRPAARPTPTVRARPATRAPSRAPTHHVAKPTSRPSNVPRPSAPATRFGGPSKPNNPVAPPRPSNVPRPSAPATRFGGPSRPNNPVAPPRPFNVPKPSAPATRFGGPSRPNNPVARPVTHAAPRYNRYGHSVVSRPVYVTSHPVVVMPGYSGIVPVSYYRPGYHGDRAAMAFGGGYALGAGGTYLAARLDDPWRHRYRPAYYSHYYGYHRPHVIHHHHHYYQDGPYFHQQWVAPRSYGSVHFNSAQPPRLPQTTQLQPEPKPEPLKTATSILYFDASSGKMEPMLFYRLKDDKELRTMSSFHVNEMLKGNHSLGKLPELLLHGNFEELEAGLDFYSEGLQKQTNMVGIALCATISSLPAFKGNVSAAQEALDKFNWKKKPEGKQFLSRILSSKEQARFELLSIAKFDYQGVVSMDAESGARIGDAHLGEESFDVNYKEQVSKCQEDISTVDATIQHIPKWLELPEVEKPLKWDPNADCEGEKAEARARKLGEEVEKAEKKTMSTEELQQQVMKDFSKSFADGHESIQLKGGYAASGIFCRGAKHASLGFCATPSKPCTELKSDCGKVLNGNKEQACQEHREKCEFVSPELVVSKLSDKYNDIKSEMSAAKCADLLDVMYTKVAMQWFHPDSRVVFTNQLGSTDIDVSSGTALMMFEMYDKQPVSEQSDSTPSATPPGAPAPTPPRSLGGQRHDHARANHGSSRKGSGSSTIATIACVMCLVGGCMCCVGCAVWFRKPSKDYDGQIDYVDDSDWAPDCGQVEYAPEFLDFQCPHGSGPGDLVEVVLPDGMPLQVTVPPNVYGGMNFSVQV